MTYFITLPPSIKSVKTISCREGTVQVVSLMGNIAEVEVIGRNSPYEDASDENIISGLIIELKRMDLGVKFSL